MLPATSAAWAAECLAAAGPGVRRIPRTSANYRAASDLANYRAVSHLANYRAASYLAEYRAASNFANYHAVSYLANRRAAVSSPSPRYATGDGPRGKTPPILPGRASTAIVHLAPWGARSLQLFCGLAWVKVAWSIDCARDPRMMNVKVGRRSAAQAKRRDDHCHR
jgi:hypothetical protein